MYFIFGLTNLGSGPSVWPGLATKFQGLKKTEKFQNIDRWGYNCDFFWPPEFDPGYLKLLDTGLDGPLIFKT